MNVAIMGAGMSGLSCAITLEKHGVTPTIFEKRSCPGDRFINAEALFSILNRPVKDCIDEIAQKYQINLKPISTVNKLVVHSKNKTSSFDGNIGYTNIRGRHSESFESQLAAQVKSKINYHSTQEYQAAAKEFDSVVLATGDGAYASQLGNYRCEVTCTIKGATVEGVFTTDTPHVWFNYEIIPKGYAWLIPFSNSEANLVIAYPNSPESKIFDVEKMWDVFYELARKVTGQDLKITDSFEITNYMMGICERPKIGSTYFVGNCFGAISPGLGFGQFSSILTGVFAAYDMLGINSYSELVKPLFANYKNSLTLRRFLEGLDDGAIDLLVNSLNVKLLDEIASHIVSSDNSFDLLKWATPLLAALKKSPAK